MKHDRLSINTLASNNNCLYHRNVFQNSFKTISKMVGHFLTEAQNFVYFVPYDFVQFSPAIGQVTNNMYGENLLGSVMTT